MSKRKTNLVCNEFYHIYNRGNGKSAIFLDDEDYDRFIKILYICNSENNFKFRDSITSLKLDAFDFERGNTLVDILGWVLMPNHFHLILISHRSDLWGIFLFRFCFSFYMYYLWLLWYDQHHHKVC